MEMSQMKANLKKIKLEICADNISSVISAEKGGADRIELCQELSVGGLTPSLGFIAQAKETVKIPVFVLIRPRSGDFCFTELETKIMEDDIRHSLEMGADGFVIGALTRTGDVNIEICRRLIDKAGNLPVTFHRAFDLTANPFQSLDSLMNLQFQRLLTSGQAETAIKGLPLIKQLVEKASDKIIIMAGCGITSNNVEELLRDSNVQEFHSSAKSVFTGSIFSPKGSVVQGTFSHNIVNINSVVKMKEMAGIISKERLKIP